MSEAEALDDAQLTGIIPIWDLRYIVMRWAHRFRPHAGLLEPEPIRIDPHLVRVVGKHFRALAARADDPDDRAQDLEAHYRQRPVAAVLVEAARLAGPTRLARFLGVGARTLRVGRQPSRETVDQLRRSVRVHLGPDHLWTVRLLEWARAQRPAICVLPGCDQSVRRAPSITCSEAHKKALRRRRLREAQGQPPRSARRFVARAEPAWPDDPGTWWPEDDAPQTWAIFRARERRWLQGGPLREEISQAIAQLGWEQARPVVAAVMDEAEPTPGGAWRRRVGARTGERLLARLRARIEEGPCVQTA